MGVRRGGGGGGGGGVDWFERPPPPQSVPLPFKSLTLKSIRIYIRLSVAQSGNNNKHCTYRQITLYKNAKWDRFSEKATL